MSFDPFADVRSLVGNYRSLLRDLEPALEASRLHALTLEKLDINSAAIEAATVQLQLAPSAVAQALAASSLLGPVQELSRLTENWRGLADKINSFLPPKSLLQWSEIASSIQSHTLNFPVLETAAFGIAWEPRFEADLKRLSGKVRSIAEKPDADREDLDDLVAEVQSVAATAPQKFRGPIQVYQRALILWLLGQVAQEPLRQMLVTLVLLLSALIPPALPDVVPPPQSPQQFGLAVRPDWQIAGLPPLIQRAGPRAEQSALAFLNEDVRNLNTRQAYANAVVHFMDWCEDRDLNLVDITSLVITAYVVEKRDQTSTSTTKQHLAAIRRLFDRFVADGVLPTNPASSIRLRPSPTHTDRSKAPEVHPDQARQLLDSIDPANLAGARDRALLSLMVYGFAPVSAIVSMNVGDYFQDSNLWWIRLRKKTGELHAIPAHSKLRKAMDGYLLLSGAWDADGAPLWRSVSKHGTLSKRRVSRVDLFRITKRRVQEAGMEATISPRGLSNAGVSAYLLNGGSRENAQAIAARARPFDVTSRIHVSALVPHVDIERISI